MQHQVSSIFKENYFTITSEEEMLEAFRPNDQKKLLVPDDFKFPMTVKSYLTWQEPSGRYTYLVFKLPNWDQPRGVAFKKTTSAGEPVGGLCSWCHSYGNSEEISFLTVTTHGQSTRAYILCQDLSCIQKIEDSTNLAGKDPDKYIAELYYRMEKLFENLRNANAE